MSLLFINVALLEGFQHLLTLEMLSK